MIDGWVASAMQGNGFITDSNIISKYRLSDANGFFSTLWDKPYVGKVCTKPAQTVKIVAGLRLQCTDSPCIQTKH